MATVLANAIKFRSLINQFSKEETQVFMNNHTELIITTLFSHFVQLSAKGDSHSNDLENVNSYLSTIIESRKKKPKDLESEPINIKLHDAPKAIIGYIASFLNQTDYFQLEKTNRSIFIACNSPNMLTKLDLCNIENYSPIKLHQFKSLKRFYTDINKCNAFVSSYNSNTDFIFTQLQELTLNAHKHTDCAIGFMNSKCLLKAPNIKQLSFTHFGDVSRGKEFNMYTFCKILNNFPNIDYLQLSGCKLHIEPSKLKEIYPKLKGLSLNGGIGWVNDELIMTFGEQLDFLLHCNSPSVSTADFSKINFNNLQEAALTTPTFKRVNDMLKTAKNLKKFYLNPDEYGIVSISQQELKIVIPKILKCKSLEFFSIDANEQNHAAILEGIQFAIYETKKLKRQQVKIEVIAENCTIDSKAMSFKVGTIIRWLETSAVLDFMFIWNLSEMDEEFIAKLNCDQILNELRDISPNIKVNTDGYGAGLFVIKNKNCKINGERESWLVDWY